MQLSPYRLQRMRRKIRQLGDDVDTTAVTPSLYPQFDDSFASMNLPASFDTSGESWDSLISEIPNFTQMFAPGGIASPLAPGTTAPLVSPSVGGQPAGGVSTSPLSNISTNPPALPPVPVSSPLSQLQSYMPYIVLGGGALVLLLALKKKRS